MHKRIPGSTTKPNHSCRRGTTQKRALKPRPRPARPVAQKPISTPKPSNVKPVFRSQDECKPRARKKYPFLKDFVLLPAQPHWEQEPSVAKKTETKEEQKLKEFE